MTQVKMYPAANGDAFLIKGGAPDNVSILIDGGYASTFERDILPDLKRLAAEGHSLNLLVATHIDADHIAGLLRLISANGNAQFPKVIPIMEVWHNSLRSLAGAPSTPEQVSAGDEQLLEEIRQRGYPRPETPDPFEISVRQGSSLAALLLGGDYLWNGSNGHRSINSAGYPTWRLTSSVQLTVISPSETRLESLRQSWVTQMRRLGFGGKIGANAAFDDAFEFLCAYANSRKVVQSETISSTRPASGRLDDLYSGDDSILNASSISLIVELGSKRLLFLADAWAEDIEASLEASAQSQSPLIFDAIKISHHGSLRNTSPRLLELIDAPHYLVSSNGKHGHPSVEVLKAVVDRPADFRRHLYFNYETAVAHELRNYTSSANTEFVIHAPVGWIDVTRQVDDR